MTSSILKVENLSKHFIIKKGVFSDKVVIDAVKNISFEVFPNESLGIIGESGSGKTTTANMLLKLIDSSEGKIRLFDIDITDLEETSMRKFRKEIQIIFQHSTSVLDPKMTIDEILKEPLKIHHIVKESELDKEVDRLLKLVGLSSTERKKFPSQLSGGQNQRIIIARAIATRPKLIVCDEPVSSLDVSVQGQILNLLIKLKKELDLTYLFISHDIKVVRHICDIIAVMYKGEIVEMGKTDDIIDYPSHEHTKKLVGSVL